MEKQEKILIGKVNVKTPGKIIISGEHSVVYHKPALVMAINLFTKSTVSVYENSEETSQGYHFIVNSAGKIISELRVGQKEDLDGTDEKQQVKENQLIRHIMIELQELLFQRAKETIIEIDIESQIPVGAGLGSSAAFSLVLSSSLYLALMISIGQIAVQENDLPFKKRIQGYADFLERIIHTNPSGVDVSVSLNGGLLKFIKGETPDKNQFEKLNQNLHSYNMILVNTNKSRNSKRTIEAVMNLKSENLDLFNEIINKIGDTSDKIIRLYQQEDDENYLLTLITENQMLLESLGVSCDEIQTIVKILSENGYNGKLTGAGGGGCVIGFIRKEKQIDSQDSFSEILTSHGFTLVNNIEISENGLDFEIAT